MAQLLKDEVRQRIIKAATAEFIQKGYENASLRRISESAQMTVGNMYRYYDSKEELLSSIIAPAYNGLSKLLNTLTNGKLCLGEKLGDLKIDKAELNNILDAMADGLIDIHNKYPDELKIMMIDSFQNQRLVDWFSEIITSFIEHHFFLPGFKKEKLLIAHSFAASIFAGVKEMLDSDDINDTVLRSLIKIYLRSYVSLLDNDIRKYIGG